MENRFDFGKIKQSPEIVEVNRLAETFYVSYHRAPKDMKVDIIEYDNNCFYGKCNYKIWGPDQGSPYNSSHPKKV